MKKKGKKVFTKTEIEQLLQLIKERRQAPSDKQKSIRNKMRKLGFYGRDEGYNRLYRNRFNTADKQWKNNCERCQYRRI